MVSLSIPSYINWANVKRFGKMFPYYITEGADVQSKALDRIVRGTKDATGKRVGGVGLKNFGQSLRTSMLETESAYKSLVAREGGFPKYVINTFRNLPSEFSGAWKASGEAATAAGKSGLWGSIKGVGGVALKRLPLIGSCIYLATQIPNIYRATKDGGIVSGAAETVKSAAKIGGFTAGMVIGQSLIPIPFVGGLIGGMLGEMLTEKVVGKSYTEQKEEIQREAIAEAQQQSFDTGSTNPFQGGMSEQQQLALLQEMVERQQGYRQA